MKLLSKYLASFVYGAFDGVVTTFAVVAAASGAGLSSNVVVILGLANLVADGFSMGASAYLSQTSERHSSRRRGKSPYRIGLVTFGAFVAVGLMPVLPYFIDVVVNTTLTSHQLFIASSFVALVAFLCIGIAKSRAGKHSILRSVSETLVLGIVAGALAYIAGDVLEAIFGA